MITPNKVIKYKESIIAKIPYIVTCLEEGSINIYELYDKTSHYFDEVMEFTFTLDVLYLLDILEYDCEKGDIIYVKACNV